MFPRTAMHGTLLLAINFFCLKYGAFTHYGLLFQESSSSKKVITNTTTLLLHSKRFGLPSSAFDRLAFAESQLFSFPSVT